MRSQIKTSTGFILTELITTIFLIGVIGSFVGFFLYTGFNGYLTSKTTVDAALRAQLALDRISIELRDIQSISSFGATAITYTNTNFVKPDDTLETRTLSYDSNTDRVFIGVSSSQYLLLDNVAAFTLSKVARDLDGDTNDDVAAINVSFTLNEMNRPFAARVFPRNLVPNP